MTSLSINLGHSYFIGTGLTEMLKWNAGIIHYVLFWNGNNGLQYTYFLNSGPQSASVNKWFLNIIYQMLQILQRYFISCFRDVETCEPQTRGLSLNSIADSLGLNILVYQWEQNKS